MAYTPNDYMDKKYEVGVTEVIVQILASNGYVYDCVVKDGITLTRETNMPAKLTCSIRRDEITAQKNNKIVLYIDGNHVIFCGFIIDTVKDVDWCSVVAYDQMWYLANNKVWHYYEGVPAENLLDVAIHDNGLATTRDWQGTEYALPPRYESNVSYLDMIQTALDITEKNTGRKYFIYDDCYNFRFLDEYHMILQYRLNADQLESYTITESLSETKTEVYVSFQVPVQTQGKTENLDGLAYAQNEDQYKRFGKLTYTDTAESGELAQAKADQLIAQVSQEPVHMTFTGCVAHPEVHGGNVVWVDFYTKDNMEFIRGWFRIDSVTFNIKGGHFTMDMETTLILPYNDWSDRSNTVPFNHLGQT